MKGIILLFALLSCSMAFGQKMDIENFINQIIQQEVPDNFNYYFLVPEGLETSEIRDSVNRYHIEEFRTSDKDLIVKLFYQNNNTEEIVDWNEFDLVKAKYVNFKYGDLKPTSPRISKNIEFVPYNIEQSDYDSIAKNRSPHTIVVRKKWIWNKRRFWKNKRFYQEVLKAWEIDEKMHKEEQVYYELSEPIFSVNKKYARISINKKRRCNGIRFTAIYKNVDGFWKKILEYNTSKSEVVTSHKKCGEISVYYVR